jgi:hypothetical protein
MSTFLSFEMSIAHASCSLNGESESPEFSSSFLADNSICLKAVGMACVLWRRKIVNEERL